MQAAADAAASGMVSVVGPMDGVDGDDRCIFW